jgi:HTH-type transcriptional regulator/antitoxin HigA
MKAQKLKYKVIKDRAQYDEYCTILESLVEEETENYELADEIELLTTLIDVYDRENSYFTELDPIELLHSFMAERNMKAIQLANYLEVSRGTISEILNYKKGLSKEMIRKLASLFKMSHEAFNRPYELIKTAAPKKSTPKTKRAVLVSR